MMRLVEPCGLVDGAQAREAVAAGLALPLAGGPVAFALARLIGYGKAALVPVRDIPAEWAEPLARVTAKRPEWAGLDPARPRIMGVLNLTPDSFSDGGAYADRSAAIEAGLAMAGAGAAVIDIGGESTRPGAAPVHPTEEQRRIIPVIEALASHGLRLSVDTRNAATMAAALDAGATIINDVSALSHDAAAAPLVAARGCPVVLMHMRGDPATMEGLARYDDVAGTVLAELGARVAAAEQAGIAPERIAIDPGIGFAKTGAQNVDLLRRLPLLLNLGRAVLVGVSRKRFIGRLSGMAEPSARNAGSIAAGLFAVSRGASVLRVHDVAGTRAAVAVWDALALSPS